MNGRRDRWMHGDEDGYEVLRFENGERVRSRGTKRSE